MLKDFVIDVIKNNLFLNIGAENLISALNAAK